MSCPRMICSMQECVRSQRHWQPPAPRPIVMHTSVMHKRTEWLNDNRKPGDASANPDGWGRLRGDPQRTNRTCHGIACPFCGQASWTSKRELLDCAHTARAPHPHRGNC